MAFISYNKFWRSEFDKIVSKREKAQCLNINQLKHQVHDSYKRDEETTTIFRAGFDKDVINKAYLDEKLSKIDGRLSFLEKGYNESKLQYNKQSVEEILIRRDVKTTMQILYDEAVFDVFPNAYGALNLFSFLTRRCGDLEEVNDDVI